MSRLARLGRLLRSGPARRGGRLLRSGPARRLAGALAAAQRGAEDVSGPYAAWAELERRGPAPLVDGDGAAPAGDRARLRLAFIVPGFQPGSGGHTTIAHLVRGLEARGHACSIWIHDPVGPGGLRDAYRRHFGPFQAAVHDGLGGWAGADVAVATAWQTVAPVMLLDGCGARAQLVQDAEPEFYPASAERLWAERAEALALPSLTAGTWLAERARARGAEATAFDLGIDLATYRPQPDVARAPERVVFYARAATPRRAVPLGLLALEELRRRRPAVEIVLFGDGAPVAAPFPFTSLGVLEPAGVARTYAEATVGLVLSLTNHSLVAQEMAACGLPAVELRTPSTEAAFGDAPIELAPPTVLGVADALERLLADPAERARRSEAGVRWAAGRTWEPAVEAVEAGLRSALRR